MNVRLPITGTCALSIATIALAACSSSTASTAATSNASAKTSTSAASSVAGKRVVFVEDTPDPVETSEECGMKQVAEEDGVEFSYQIPTTFGPSYQIPVLDSVIASKPAVIIISPSDPKALVTPLKQAAAEGIKIVLVQHSLVDQSFVTTSVDQNDYQNGYDAAQLIGNWAKGKTGSVAIITYTPGASSVTDARTRGFEAGLKSFSNLKFVGVTVVNSLSVESGAAAANAIISAHPDLIGLAGTSEGYSTGMAEAIQQRGLSSKIAAVQMDASAKALQLLNSGAFIGFSSAQAYPLGQEAMTEAVRVLQGGQVNKTSPLIPQVAITKSNENSPQYSLVLSTASKAC